MRSRANIPQDTNSKILETARRFQVPARLSKSTVWKSMRLKEQRQFFLTPAWAYKIAASVLILAGVALSSLLATNVSITTAKGEHRTVKLPDHSTIKLNAESQLSYNKLLWQINRKVNFGGEGIFQVSKGSTFSVFTDNGPIVKVLGTSFDILAREKRFRVACMTGKVSVEQRNERVLLTPGLNTQQQSNKLTQPEPFDKKILAWENGEFYFSNASLTTVLTEIERQFNITISYKNANQRYWTGYFNNRDLDEALKLVCLPLGLKYKIKSAKKVTIINERNV